VHAGLGRLHRVALVEDGRGRAGEVIDLVHLDIERERHVVPQHLEPLLAQQVLDVLSRTRVEVVDDQHLVTVGQQPADEMRADETGAAGDHDAARAQVEEIGRTHPR